MEVPRFDQSSYSNSPTVHQVISLYDRLSDTVQKQQRSKVDLNGAEKFSPKRLHGLTATGENLYYWEHRFSGQVIFNGVQDLELRINSTLLTQDQDSGSVDGSITAYTFAFSDDEVRIAKKDEMNAESSICGDDQDSLASFELLSGGDGKVEANIGVFGDEQERQQVVWVREPTRDITPEECSILGLAINRFCRASILMHYRALDTRIYDPFAHYRAEAEE